MTVRWMEFGGRYHFGQFFHVRWLDIDNVCTRKKCWNEHSSCQYVQQSPSGYSPRLDKNMKNSLNDWFVISKCHKLMRKSSADKYVSWSLFTDILLMWYVCALAYTRLGDACWMRTIQILSIKFTRTSTTNCMGTSRGTRNWVAFDGGVQRAPPVMLLSVVPAAVDSSARVFQEPSPTRRSRSLIFHNLIVLSAQITWLNYV